MLRRLYYILLQRLFVFRNRNKPCQGKVFMFHDISDKNDTYSISKESFNELMNHLFENNNIVSVEKMISDLSDDDVVITFDDAYASVYHNAYPLLKELDVPFYVFICNEYLNKEDYLSEDMIKDGNWKMNPPLRSKANMEATIEALLDGTADMIACDHAPHTEEEGDRLCQQRAAFRRL